MGLHSLPVSPFLLPVYGMGQSTTPFDSPSLLQLDAVDEIPQYAFPCAVVDGRFTLGSGNFEPPFMMHRPSQQTVVQRPMVPPAGEAHYMPTFDAEEDEMQDTLAQDLEKTHLFQVLPPEPQYI